MPQRSLVSWSAHSAASGWRRALLAAASATSLLVLAACGKQEAPPEPERYVRTLVLTPQSAGLQREFAAEVRARIESRLSFRVAGKILERRVDLGSVVKPGQALARLDSSDLVLAQEAAKAGVLAARVNRDQLGADYKRYIDLHRQGFISAAELDRRDAAFKAAQAQFDQARAQSDVQRNQAQYSTLVADVAGVVTGIDAEPGMVVAAGTPVLRVANDGPRDVVFSVSEDQVALVRAAAARPDGLKVKLWTDAKAEPQPIKLRELAAAADPVTRTFLVKAELKDQTVHLGQTATVILTGTPADNAIKLPLSAVMESQGKSAVLLLDGKTMTVSPKPVTVVGAEGNELIVQGLASGMEVVTAGGHVLTPGQKVKRFRPPGASTEPAAPAPQASAQR
ncbi:MAG: efflux RND transporter periplasmic adaptor subunit [Mitsuaria chitosanitabida]|uniref:efflux RND transporter periplasmic adaptor subunit n=1 Tax=Roseateles chitosanitabidus TaxID=65048 RepID=UPI001B081968|nr:efflux RND transporter periplasmic adaptor subunit [Roseateles chitosanitabidus]MBO9688072.1 efflux RND transporter periplasmic adaptor subunit [Roseateles chitosanitabidus]